MLSPGVPKILIRLGTAFGDAQTQCQQGFAGDLTILTCSPRKIMPAMYRSAFDNRQPSKLLTERVDREMKRYLLEEKKSQLINLAQLEPAMVEMVDVFKAELLKLDDQLKADLNARYGIDIDISVLNGYVFGALKHFSRFDAGNTDFD